MRFKEHPALTRGSDMFRVDPRALHVDPGFNVRDLDAPAARDALDLLKESIRVEGVQVPLEVRLKGLDLFIVSGHRRHRAVLDLIAEGVAIETIPCVSEPKTVSDADRTVRLITLNSGEPLTALEKAAVVQRLLNYGWTRDAIRDRLGFKTSQTIANFELLLGAPEDAKQAIRAGEVSASTVVQWERAGTTEAALPAARAVVASTGARKITAAVTGSKKPSVPTVSAAPKPAPADDTVANPTKALERAIASLIVLSTANTNPSTLAATYGFMRQPVSAITEVADWLVCFADELTLLHNAGKAPSGK